MNEEQMRAEFEAWFWVEEGYKQVQFDAWQAAHASRQPEIDALKEQLAEMQVQVLRAVEVLKSDRIERTPIAISTLTECGLKELTAIKAIRWLNEQKANALETAADHEELYQERDVLRKMAKELRGE